MQGKDSPTMKFEGKKVTRGGVFDNLEDAVLFRTTYYESFRGGKSGFPHTWTRRKKASTKKRKPEAAAEAKEEWETAAAPVMVVPTKKARRRPRSDSMA